MNKDQIKGTAKKAAGKIQEQAGKMVGGKKQQAKGLAKQATGQAQKSAGDVAESVEEGVSRTSRKH